MVRISKLIEALNKEGVGKFQVVYIQKDPAKMGDQLLEALAADTAPDLAILPQDLIFHHRSKLFPIPFSSVTERQYQDLFVDGAKIFKSADGYLALPVAVDPLVLYYNKDLYKSANIVTPPSNWEQLVLDQPKLTMIDSLNKISQSAVALGTSNNINNVKDIFALLSLQSGAAPISFDGTKLSSAMLADTGAYNPSQTSLDFYTQFSNPQLSTYTWNRSLPLDRDYFLSGKLANYFGLASELPDIIEKNPHLNFDIALTPRLSNGENLTLGHFYGLVVLKRSTKLTSALAAAFALAFTDREEQVSEGLDACPVKRILIGQGDPDPRRQVFLDEALISTSWPDPADDKTTVIIKKMIDGVVSGQGSSIDAVKKADEDLRLLLAQ